jgi:hypothetical protein
MGWGGSETPCFVGRAVAALADEYGFTDITGAHPDHAALDAAVEQAKKTYLAPMMEASASMKVDWRVAPK